MRRVIAGAAALLMACGGSDECSTEGCPFGYVASVTVHAPTGVDAVDDGALVVCVGDDCATTSFQAGSAGAVETVSVAGEDGDDVSAELTMPDGQTYAATGELADYRPNGDCGQTCTGAEVTLSAAPA